MRAGDVVGVRLREARESRGWRQEDVSTGMRSAGLPWQRVTVAAVEAGTREIRLVEQAALCGVFGVAWVDLVAWPECPDLAIEVAPTLTVAWSHLLGALATGHALASAGGAVRYLPDETDIKAARTLGVEAQQVRKMALGRWGRSLSSERDHRLRETEAGQGETAQRTIQAARGRITRTLMTELAATGDQP